MLIISGSVVICFLDLWTMFRTRFIPHKMFCTYTILHISKIPKDCGAISFSVVKTSDIYIYFFIFFEIYLNGKNIDLTDKIMHADENVCRIRKVSRFKIFQSVVNEKIKTNCSAWMFLFLDSKVIISFRNRWY